MTPLPLPGGVDLVGDALLVAVKHVHDERVEQLPQVALAVDLEAEGHDLTGQTVAAEQSLHTVRDLHLEGTENNMLSRPIFCCFF